MFVLMENLEYSGSSFSLVRVALATNPFHFYCTRFVQLLPSLRDDGHGYS